MGPKKDNMDVSLGEAKVTPRHAHLASMHAVMPNGLVFMNFLNLLILC